MTSRERVFRTLEFRNPDRAPRDLWALGWVGTYAKDDFEAVGAEFPGDFGGAPGVLGAGERANADAGGKNSYVDEWGCVWVRGEEGVVGEVKIAPIADWSALATYQPPWEMINNAKLDVLNKPRKKPDDGNEKFLRGACCPRPFERLQFLRGSENLYMDLAYDPPEFRRLVEMVHEFFLKHLELVIQTDCDFVPFMDDWGSQQALLIAPTTWREVFKPFYKQYCDMIHGAGKKVFFHSDGHIFDIYEDLIEIGVDAVNSQLFCMDIEEIAKRFKGRITFWGEISRQDTLPFGTVEDVHRAVGRVRRALDDGTGGVIAQCEWGVNNPPANIRAVFEAWDAPIESLP